MASDMTYSPKPLRDVKTYHCSILYNYYEGQPSGRQGDHILAWNFLMDLKGKLKGKGYTELMYYDIALPGSNIFDNLSVMIKQSEKIVVLLTPKYIQNGWHKYSGQFARKSLLDRNEADSMLIPIAININKENIPDNLGLSVARIIYTGYENNEADEGIWDKVLEAFVHTELTVPPIAIKNSHDLEVDGPADGTVDGVRWRNENASEPKTERTCPLKKPRSEYWYHRALSWLWRDKMEHFF